MSVLVGTLAAIPAYKDMSQLQLALPSTKLSQTPHTYKLGTCTQSPKRVTNTIPLSHKQIIPIKPCYCNFEVFIASASAEGQLPTTTKPTS